MPFPKETSIFGFTMADIRGTGKPEMITLDSIDNRVRIFSEDGKVQWKSTDRFGGTNNSYDTKKKWDPAYKPTDAVAMRVYIPARILARDLNGEGIPQVIINKNEFGTGNTFRRLRSYEKGEIYNLIWEEDSLTTNWKTREIKGYIADYQIGDADNDGNAELVVAVVAPAADEGILSRKSKSNLYFYKLF